MIDASLRVLRTDVAGMPIEWIGFEEAVRLHCLDQILYPMGSVLYHVHYSVCKWGHDYLDKYFKTKVEQNNFYYRVCAPDSPKSYRIKN